MACKQKKFPGKVVIIEYVIGCPSVFPSASEWKRIGAMRAKEYTLSWDSTDATDDSSVGSIRESLMTFLSVELSGDGTIKNDNGQDEKSVVELEKHVSNPIATGGQPAAWFRITDPRLTRTVYMNISEFTPLSAPYDDVTTWSFSASATASDFGLIVEDTPDPDAEDVASVTVTPATGAIPVGGTVALSTVVAPAGAPQGIVYQSSDTPIATVTQAGLVTGVGEGVAEITVRSLADGTKSDIAEITITA
ncbi:Ig-like domain-containing protein [Bordetella trematum]|uniref:Ig-like domain-containing protein n=1 Tax=Bordetella trematum TaxID=123899 RepID=UPI000471384F|nr:Ig-like domain-containing protein [Bordetella trematum]